MSIAIAALDAAAHVGDALASIPAAAEDVDLEVVLADGGSRDDTLRIATEAAERHAIELTVLPGPDSGIYDGMNRALAHARGRFVLILNSDDRLRPRALPRLLKTACRDDYDVVSGSAVVERRGGGWRTVRNDARPMTLEGILFGVPIVNARLFRLGVLRQLAGPFRTDLGIAADREFLLKIWRSCGRRGAIRETVYEYRSHADSKTIAGDDAARGRVFRADLELSERCLSAETDSRTSDAFKNLRAASLVKLAALHSLGRSLGRDKGTPLRLARAALSAPLRTARGVGAAIAWRGRGSGW